MTKGNESSSDSDNNTSDSASTSQISTSEEIDYDFPEYKGPPNSLLKWYGYLSDEYKDNGRFWDSNSGEIIVFSSDNSDDRKGPSKSSVPIFEGPPVQGLLDWYGYNTIEEYLSWNYFPSTDKDITDEDCIHESNYAMSKGKYVPVSHKHNPKVKSPVPVTGCVLGLANVTTWDEIVNKLGVMKSEICAYKAKGKRKVSDDRKRPSKASVPIFEGPSVQELLDWYGYNTIEEYLSWNYFSSTYKDITDKDITDEDCIHESNYAMSKDKYVPVSQKHNPKVKSPAPTRQRGKERCQMEANHVLVKDQIEASNCSLHLKVSHPASCFCSLHWQLAFAACICILHLQLAFVSKHLQLAFTGCICSLHLQLAFASCICILHLKIAYPATSTCSIRAFAISICYKYLLCCKLLQQAFSSKHLLQVFALLQATATSICSKHLHLAFALQLAFSASI
ncbi:hypothetical protein Tco_1205481 [Tanacetum coccineum]